MKKVISLLTALSAAAVVFAAGASAADREKGEPDVFVDGSKIIFEDQNAVIADDVTLVPARGVFQAMDCDVEWDGTDRKVTVTSSTGVRYVVITIDSDTMQINTFKTLMEIDRGEYKLEVPARIINDRTMIPLRAVSEAFGCEVNWDADEYAVNITTSDPMLLEGYTYTAPAEEDMVKMSLSTDHEGALNAGDEFTVYVNANNIPERNYCSGVTATFEYDKSKFEYVEGTGALLNDNDETIEASSYAENAELAKGAMMFFVTVEGDTARTKDGKVLAAKFRSRTGEGGEISLSNDYDPATGYESCVMFTEITEGKAIDSFYDGKNLMVDTTPLTIGE